MEEKSSSNNFQQPYTQEQLLQMKSQLGVIRVALEEQLKKKEEELLIFQRDLPQLVHKERLLRFLSNKKSGKVS